ncbi:MAG: flagellar motor switch protein [Shimia sp.]|nr:flagellar motor switch protein [Shimia sp.]
MIETITDTVIILLLIGSILYGWLISRRVQRLMGVLRELEPMVESYSAAVDKSAASVTEMKDQVTKAEEQANAQAEAPLQETTSPQQEDAGFVSQRATARPRNVPGLQRVSGKQELVRLFFQSSHANGEA